MKKFKAFLKRESIIYFVILLLLALLSHGDLVTNPLSRFEMMMERGNYFHPFVYAFVLYAIILIVRKTLDFISSLFGK